MTNRLNRLAVLLWAFAISTAPVAAQEPAVPGTNRTTAEPEPFQRWLDAVRIQRQAREAEREAAKKDMEARHRWRDPWGAAKKEARDKENQRRRESFREEIERKREALRGQAPWSTQTLPWQAMPAGQPDPPTPDDLDQDRENAPTGAMPPATAYPPLPGWDNRWYYRGY